MKTNDFNSLNTMKKLLLVLIMFAAISCKEEVKLVPFQRTLNGTVWKKFEFRQGDRDVHKILSFRAPNIINVSIRDDSGYLVSNVQEEYTYIYEHPLLQVDGPWDIDFKGRIIDEKEMEFQGEVFIKSK